MEFVASQETAAKLSSLIGQATPLAGGVPPSAVADEVVVVQATGSTIGKLVYYTGSAWADTTGTNTVTLLGLAGGTFTTGTRYTAVPFGIDVGNSRGRYLVTGGTGGGIVSITANADNAGTAWTQGTITGGEVVDIQPRYGAGVSVGSLTYPAHKVWNTLEYLGRDTGTTSSGTNRRRFVVWPIGLVACDSSVSPSVLRTL